MAEVAVLAQKLKAGGSGATPEGSPDALPPNSWKGASSKAIAAIAKSSTLSVSETSSCTV
eukprot:2887926-Prymnesium_polylepis.1